METTVQKCLFTKQGFSRSSHHRGELVGMVDSAARDAVTRDVVTMIGAARKGRQQAGFTLIEVMVVVIILGILAAVVVPNVMDKPGQARITAAKQDIRALESALNMYKLDNFRYPTSDQGLEALVTKPGGAPEPKNWKQYMPRLPKDPWGEPYQYLSADGSSVEIISLGSDGAVGGEGEAADIKNTELGK